MSTKNLTLTPAIVKPRVYGTKIFYLIVAGIIALVLTPTLVYYTMSYNSVNGTVVQLASARRGVSHGFFSSSIVSVTYYVEVHVWSYATSIDTRVNQPVFSLIVDSYAIDTARGGSGTFKPYGYLVYSLTFTTIDSTVANAVGKPASNDMNLGMDALVSAGLFSEQVTKGDSATWTFSG